MVGGRRSWARQPDAHREFRGGVERRRRWGADSSPTRLLEYRARVSSRRWCRPWVVRLARFPWSWMKLRDDLAQEEVRERMEANSPGAIRQRSRRGASPATRHDSSPLAGGREHSPVRSLRWLRGAIEGGFVGCSAPRLRFDVRRFRGRGTRLAIRRLYHAGWILVCPGSSLRTRKTHAPLRLGSQRSWRIGGILTGFGTLARSGIAVTRNGSSS